MSYHITNLGSFSNRVRRYADLDGYVPEDGDPRQYFTYDTSGDDFDEDTWAEWVASAIAATEEAERGLACWRRGGA